MSSKDNGPRRVGSGVPLRAWNSNSYDPATGRAASSLDDDGSSAHVVAGNHGNALRRHAGW